MMVLVQMQDRHAEEAGGLVAEVPSKFARAGGGRPDFGPKKKQKNTQKTLIKPS
jgi:hypothetical protein